MLMVRESCGIFGVYSEDKAEHVAKAIYEGLIALQHRGQESAGISVFDGSRVKTHRGMGVAFQVFGSRELQSLAGYAGIGHVRYSTTGASAIENAQPFFLQSPKISFAIALNGNIINYRALKATLEDKGYVFTTTTDTELVAHLLAAEFAKSEDLFAAFKALMKQLDGSYSLLLLTEKGRIAACRDPMGFKPLCLGRRRDAHVLASETVALDAVGAGFVRELEPGEVLVISNKGIESRVLQQCRHAHCMFEYVYFARPDSVFEGGISINQVRENLGRILAELYPVAADVIVPVPDSGRSAAVGYSLATGLPVREGLMKNRYIFRTFILPSKEQREYSVRLKLNAVRSIVEGKRVVLIDDSIVRGTTQKKIVKLLKEAGAKEVHVRISCPPIIAPCFMGIDFPTYEELIAANKSVEEIRKTIGADSLGYMTLDGLVRAIGLPREELCMACLNKEYPVKTS
jgi:amidophosphoribosyltransferase